MKSIFYHALPLFVRVFLFFGGFFVGGMRSELVTPDGHRNIKQKKEREVR